MNFTTTLLQIGNNTGIPLPEQVLEQLGGGKKPLVKVTLNNYTYRSAVAKMGDQYLISLSAENRKNAGVKGGDELDVTIELDAEPRTVDVPEDLAILLDQNIAARATFDKLSPSKKKALVLSITDVKTAETRQKRVAKAMEGLGAG